jgi:hypothetical protein
MGRVFLSKGILEWRQETLGLHQLAKNKRGAMELHPSRDNELMSLSLRHQNIGFEVMGPLLRVPVEHSEKIPVTLTPQHSLPLDKILLYGSYIGVTGEQRKERGLASSNRALEMNSKVRTLVKRHDSETQTKTWTEVTRRIYKNSTTT